MRRLTLTLTLTATLFMHGCATKSPATSTSEAPQASAPATTPVNVPAASARKIVMSMTGPKQVVEAKDWGDFKREWKDTFSEYAKTAKISFDLVDAGGQPTGQDGTLLLVNVADYKMVGIGARIMFGIMTGNAYIDANVKYLNLRDGAALGEQQYNTTSSAWGGILSKVTPQQVDAIGAQVFKSFKAAEQ